MYGGELKLNCLKATHTHTATKNVPQSSRHSTIRLNTQIQRIMTSVYVNAPKHDYCCYKRIPNKFHTNENGKNFLHSSGCG